MQKCTRKFCTNFAKFVHAKNSHVEKRGFVIGLDRFLCVQNLQKNVQKFAKICKFCKKFPWRVFSKSAFFPGYVKFFWKMRVHTKSKISEIFTFFFARFFSQFFSKNLSSSNVNQHFEKLHFCEKFRVQKCANFWNSLYSPLGGVEDSEITFSEILQKKMSYYFMTTFWKFWEAALLNIVGTSM